MEGEEAPVSTPRFVVDDLTVIESDGGAAKALPSSFGSSFSGEINVERFRTLCVKLAYTYSSATSVQAQLEVSQDGSNWANAYDSVEGVSTPVVETFTPGGASFVASWLWDVSPYKHARIRVLADAADTAILSAAGAN